MNIGFSAYTLPELEEQLDHLHHRLDMVNIAIGEAEEKYATSPHHDIGYLRVDMDRWCNFLDYERECLQQSIYDLTQTIVEYKAKLRGY